MSATPSSDQPRSYSLALFGTVFHAAMTSALLATYIWHVYPAKQVFKEFGLTLPWISQNIIYLSDLLVTHWKVITPALPLLPVVDFAVAQLLGRHGRSTQVLWIVGIGLLLVAVGIFTVIVIELPILKLKEGLSH
jgi:ABC-type polysaccharide/polyol phosphate export permease